MRALLALEDGTLFFGRSFGATREAGGEVVFNTSMTGYQEILTDPSYHGQIVVFTAPQIGNYGVHRFHGESSIPRVAGMIVREVSEIAAHPEATRDLGRYLRENQCFGLTEVDTRALTLHLRRRGTVRGWLTNEVAQPEDAVEKAQSVPPMDQIPAVAEVTTRMVWTWPELSGEQDGAADVPSPADRPGPGLDPGLLVPGDAPRIAVLDCGVKFNILRELARRGCVPIVLPAETEASVIDQLAPDGILLSNGPGDPASLREWTPRIRRLLERYPTLAICLGHQVASLALGCRTVKLPFGHHGGNHPVKEISSGHVWITAQNHNYAVDPGSLPGELEVTHLNLNDGTVEGVRHRDLPLWSLQFHPEASPGPHDAVRVFDAFVEAVARPAHPSRWGRTGDHQAASMGE